MMRRSLFVGSFLFLSFALWTGIAAHVSPLAAGEVQGPTAADELITRGVLEIVQKDHLLKREIDDEIASCALDNFIKYLDPQKRFFLKSDIEEFNRGKRGLASALKKGDVSLGFKVFRRYQRRVAEALKTWEQLLKPGADVDFTRDEVLLLNPKALDHAKDKDTQTERERLWVKYKLLQTKTDPDTKEFNKAEACMKLLGHYERFAGRIEWSPSDHVLELFLTRILQRFDSKTYYMSRSSTEEWRNQLNGNLVGIGVRLSQDDSGGIIIHEVVPNGPAEKAGLMPKDRIVSVDKEDNGDAVDVRGMTPGEVPTLIRGEAGKRLRLTVVRKGKHLALSMTRAKIALPEAKVEGRIFQQGKKSDGKPYKIGYLDMPSFYRDASTPKSSTLDAKKQLKRFEAEGADLVVLDMRRCGGGGLSEAKSLAGLFLGGAPILQRKDKAGTIQTEGYYVVETADGFFTKASMAWTKGLVIITGKQTASGAEIVCAAIRDCNRGLLVGAESTYGKGTIQTAWPVAAKFLKTENAPDLGLIVVTTDQVYRLNGDGIEKRGVRADVVLPTLDSIESREEFEGASALGFDRVPATQFPNYNMVSKETVSLLLAGSQARVDSSSDFTKLQKRFEWEQNKREQLLAFLNEEKYRAWEKDNAPPSLPETKPGELDYYLKEVLAIAADYGGFLGDKIATPPVVAEKSAPPAPDPKVVRAAEKAKVGTKVRQLEKNLSAINDKIFITRASLAGAKQGLEKLKKQEPDSFVKIAFAEAAVAAAQRVLDDFVADRDRIEADLKGARDRYNKLESGQ